MSLQQGRDGDAGWNAPDKKRRVVENRTAGSISMPFVVRPVLRSRHVSGDHLSPRLAGFGAARLALVGNVLRTGLMVRPVVGRLR